MKKLNKNLLIELLSIQSTSNDDVEILNYIKTFIDNIPDIVTTIDEFGNLYCTKGSGSDGYKCVVSHVDTVHDLFQKRAVYEFEDKLFAYGMKIISKGTTFESEKYSQVGIGGDDRCGNYICLQMLIHFNDIKVVFFRKEEIGRLGAKACNLEFFDNCNFILEPDRKHNCDFITTSAGIKMSSPEFVKTIQDILTNYSYKECVGVATDVDVLKSRGVKVCCANISCGYYDAHSDCEYISITDLQKCENLIFDIFNTFGNVRFEHEYSAPTYTYQYTNYASNYNTKNTTSLRFATHVLFGKNTYYDDIYYLRNDKLPLKVDASCPCCGKRHLYFLPIEETFYCTACNDYIYNGKTLEILFKQFSVISNRMVAGTESSNTDTFIYSESARGFLKREDAFWNDTSKMYEEIPKDYTTYE